MGSISDSRNSSGSAHINWGRVSANKGREDQSESGRTNQALENDLTEVIWFVLRGSADAYSVLQSRANLRNDRRLRWD